MHGVFKLPRVFLFFFFLRFEFSVISSELLIKRERTSFRREFQTVVGEIRFFFFFLCIPHP